MFCILLVYNTCSKSVINTPWVFPATEFHSNTAECTKRTFPLKTYSQAHYEMISDNCKPVKNDENCFPFHMKRSSFHPEDNQIFVQALLVTHENRLIRKLRLISKFIKQTITIFILRNVSRSKSNPTMKFGQLIQYLARKTFLLKNRIEIWWRN